MPGPISDSSLRIFKVEELNTIRSLIVKTLEESYADVYPPGAIDFFKEYHSIENILEDARAGYTLVLELDGKIAGTGTLLGSDIRRVFIDPDYQRQGLGKIIMLKLEEKAAENGITVIGLSSSLPAKEFYLSLGYLITEEKTDLVNNDAPLHYYEMIKNLKTGRVGAIR